MINIFTGRMAAISCACLAEVESEKIVGAPKPMIVMDEAFLLVIWGGEGSPPSSRNVRAKSGGEPKELTPASWERVGFQSIRLRLLDDR